MGFCAAGSYLSTEVRGHVVQQFLVLLFSLEGPARTKDPTRGSNGVDKAKPKARERRKQWGPRLDPTR